MHNLHICGFPRLDNSRRRLSMNSKQKKLSENISNKNFCSNSFIPFLDKVYDSVANFLVFLGKIYVFVTDSVSFKVPKP